MVGVDGGRFTALVFMGVSFDCTISGLALACLVVFFAGACAFVLAVVVFFVPVVFFVVFAMICSLFFFSNLTDRCYKYLRINQGVSRRGRRLPYNNSVSSVVKILHCFLQKWCLTLLRLLLVIGS
jgi:hypothetical protein